MLRKNIIKKFQTLLGEHAVKTDSHSLQIYGKDLTQIFIPNPSAIVFPKNISDLQKIVNLANQYKISLVPSGGRTGYSGGAVAANHEVIVVFERMNQILDFNPIDRLVICQPGVTLKTLQDFAATKKLFYPIDIAPADTCQIGGNISTNAGGIRVIHYGLTRRWVAGLKVITGKGDLLNLNKGLIKNATGYDLMQLFIGSEGTLGLIAEASLHLAIAPKNLTVILLAVNNIEHILQILFFFRKNLDLTAFEFFSQAALEKVLAKHSLSQLIKKANFYALIEFDNVSPEIKQLAIQVLNKCLQEKLVQEGCISENPQQAQNFWQLRKLISRSLADFFPYKFDIAVVTSKISQCIKKINDVAKVKFPECPIIWFGHIGDGNLHLNILKPENLPNQNFLTLCEKNSKFIFEIISQLDGTIAAEHGVGLLKKKYLKYTRSPEEIAYMRTIKAIFDPNKILNPGKIFD